MKIEQLFVKRVIYQVIIGEKTIEMGVHKGCWKLKVAR